MLYAIITEDVDGSLANRLSARPAHLARLTELQSQGRLILAGPHPAVDSEEPEESGYTGSLIVADFESLSDATSWAETAFSATATEIKDAPFLVARAKMSFA